MTAMPAETPKDTTAPITVSPPNVWLYNQPVQDCGLPLPILFASSWSATGMIRCSKAMSRTVISPTMMGRR